MKKRRNTTPKTLSDVVQPRTTHPYKRGSTRHPKRQEPLDLSVATQDLHAVAGHFMDAAVSDANTSHAEEPTEVAPVPAPDMDCGPYDYAQCPQVWQARLVEHYKRGWSRRHTKDDVLGHPVVTNHLSLYIPDNTHAVQVENVTAAPVQSYEPNDGDIDPRLAAMLNDVRHHDDPTPRRETVNDVLHLKVSESAIRPEVLLSISVFAAPRSGKLWREKGLGYAMQLAGEDGGEVTLIRTPWGTGVRGRWSHQDVYVVGVDGAGWCVRITATAPTVNTAVRRLVHDVVASCIVKREARPYPPGSALDVTPIPRSATPKREVYAGHSIAAGVA